MDFHMVSGNSMNPRYLHGLWCQHVPWTSVWSLVAGQSTDINATLCCRTGQRHHQSSQQQRRLRMSTQLLEHHGPVTPIWSPAGARLMGINMAPGGPQI